MSDRPAAREIWSKDRQEVTFLRPGAESRVERFVERVRATLPIYARNLPEGLAGADAVANARWLTREDYQGPLRDQAFALVARKHFVHDLSSGTTGEPVLRFNTWDDELSEQLMTRRCFELAGVGPTDSMVYLEVGAAEVGTFYFRAMAELGVRDLSFLQVTTDFFGSIAPLERMNPTVILTVPSILARCGPRFFEMYDGRRPRALERVIFYAEPLSDALRAHLDGLGVESFSFYGTTELGGVAGECSAHAGLHVQDDWILPTLRRVERLEPGRYAGELGWTAMHYEAQPLVKYAVGDVVEIDNRPCACGQPGVRMRFRARTFDVIDVFGLKFPFASIERALANVVGDGDPLVQLVVTDAPKGVKLTVRVCRDYDVSEEAIHGALYHLFEFDDMLEIGLVTLEVEPVDRAVFSSHKLRRVIDRRQVVPFSHEAPSE